MVNKSDIPYKQVEWIVLTKAPIPGLVKTRLIPALGKQGACDVYCQLLNRLQQTLRSMIAKRGGEVALWIAGDDEQGVFQSWADFSVSYQQPAYHLGEASEGVDLGVRMAMAVKAALSRKRIPVLIGVDVPDLTEDYLLNCLVELADHDLVISPAEDGGYYLLGMKSFKKKLFINKNWGTSSVLKNTLNDLKKEKTKLLEPRNDVDYYEDIKDVDAFDLFLKHIKE